MNDTLNEIDKLSDSVRENYKSLKRGNAETEQTLEKILTPLNALVKQGERFCN